jgi:hypothetical protein
MRKHLRGQAISQLLFINSELAAFISCKLLFYITIQNKSDSFIIPPPKKNIEGRWIIHSVLDNEMCMYEHRTITSPAAKYIGQFGNRYFRDWEYIKR